MNGNTLLLLVLCAAVLGVCADRRRPEHEQRRRHYHHHDDDDDDDDAEPRMSHLSDYESNSWRHEHHTWKPKDNRHTHGQYPVKGQWKGNDQKKEPKNNQWYQREHDDEPADRTGGNRGHGDHHSRRDQNQTKDWKKKSYEPQSHHDRHDDRQRDRTSQNRHEQQSQEHVSHTTASGENRHAIHSRELEHPNAIHSRELEHPNAIIANTDSSEALSSISDTQEGAASSPAVDVKTAPPSWSGDPPPHEKAAAMARYIVHVSDWAAMATISTRPHTRGAPFANVFSVADGTKYRSSGIPYMYLTDWEMSVKDLRVNNKASLTMSLAQSEYCAAHQFDPESPLCAHVILSGTVRQVDETEPDYTFAKDALFARHPAMADWPTSHEWFVAMLEIEDIIVLDYFGGAITVSKDEYFAASPFTVPEGRSSNTV